MVLGQPDAVSHSENRGGPAGPASFRWPHDIAGRDDLLLVADAGDHRVLGWTPQPDADRPADLVVGQPDFTSAEEWPYGPHTADRMRFPYAVSLDATGGQERLAVADTANNRVLLWDGMPDGPIVPGRSTFLRSRISVPTARIGGRRCSTTPCAGPTGCRCAVTPLPSPTPATTG